MLVRAQYGYQWVWIGVAEMIWGEERKKGMPLPVHLYKVCPRSWLDKQYVKESPIEMERR